MTWVDYAVAGITVVSVLVGLLRGIAREVVGLAGWVIAFLAAHLFAGPLAAHVPEAVPSPELRAAVAFVAVFVIVLVLAALLAALLARALKSAGLGGLDRSLGALFGLARALLLVLALVVLAALVGLPRQPSWRDSVSGPWLGAAGERLRPWLPPSLAERLRYDGAPAQKSD
jgi:membrane protein required for colicin V production